jgi:hypothetical protein
MGHIVQVFSLKDNTDVKNNETSEKCSILSKAKKGDNFSRRYTFSILRIKILACRNAVEIPIIGDAGIGKKRTFFRGLGEIVL